MCVCVGLPGATEALGDTYVRLREREREPERARDREKEREKVRETWWSFRTICYARRRRRRLILASPHPAERPLVPPIQSKKYSGFGCSVSVMGRRCTNTNRSRESEDFPAERPGREGGREGGTEREKECFRSFRSCARLCACSRSVDTRQHKAISQPVL